MTICRMAYICVGVACVVGALGCGPRINQFVVKPQVLCEGDKAVIRWDATGELGMALQPEPLPAGDPECAASGRDTVALTLVARKGGDEVERTVEVVEVHATAAEPVVFRTSAIDGADVVASGEKNLALWADRVELKTVAACLHRAVAVIHADKTATLSADGTPSDAFAGTALGGTWELRSPMSPAEQHDPPLRPKELKVLATIRCRTEQP